MGLGFATLRPVNGTAALTTADADGIIVAGLLIDAGPKLSPILMQVGEAGSHASHAKNPISLHDVFFRVGGAGTGQRGRGSQKSTPTTPSSITPGSGGPIMEAGAGWTTNPSANGLVVNVQQRHRLRPSLWSITSSTRCFGTAMAAGHIFINRKFPTIRRISRAIPAEWIRRAGASTAGRRTKWLMASPATRPGGSAFTPSSAIPTW